MTPTSNVVWEIHEDRIQRLEGDVKTIASDVAEVKAYQKTQYRQLEAQGRRIEQVGERVGRMEGGLRDAVDELKDHIDGRVGGVEKRVDALEFRREEKLQATNFWRKAAIGLLIAAAGSLIPIGHQLLLRVLGG